MQDDQIHVRIDGKQVEIPVSSAVKAYFDSQFSRTNPTPLQKRRYTTLRNLIIAAYKAGQSSRA